MNVRYRYLKIVMIVMANMGKYGIIPKPEFVEIFGGIP